MAEVSEQVHEFLRRQRNVVLSTVRADGSPQISPLWYLWDGERFILSTAKETAKWTNVERDQRVALCVDQPETGQMVVAYGKAELQEKDVRPLTKALCEKYLPPERVEPHLDFIFERYTRTLIIVKPDKIISRNLDGPKTREVK